MCVGGQRASPWVLLGSVCYTLATAHRYGEFKSSQGSHIWALHRDTLQGLGINFIKFALS